MSDLYHRVNLSKKHEQWGEIVKCAVHLGIEATFRELTEASELARHGSEVYSEGEVCRKREGERRLRTQYCIHLE